MPRFFFHLREDTDVPDEEGRDLPDCETAVRVGTSEARELIADELRMTGRVVRSHRIEIADDLGRIVGRVQFADAVELVG